MPTAEPFFIVREERFLSLLKTPNPFAQVDFYLRRTKLHAPLLEVLRSDEFRVAIVERLAPTWDNPPPDALWDLTAGALARRDVPLALQLLELKRTLARPPPNEILLLIYLYCVNGDVEKAEALARSDAASVPKDSVFDWLWGKLRAEYGFHPPP